MMICRTLEQMLAAGEEITGGPLLEAARCWQEGREDRSLDVLLRARRESHTLDGGSIFNLIWLMRRKGLVEEAALECLGYAHDAVGAGLDDLALEACSGALFLDHLARFEITRDPRWGLKLRDLYEGVARRMAVQAVKPHEAAARRRVALVVPNLVDYTVAATQLLLQFARYTDRSRYDLRVYSTENLGSRDAPVFPFGVVNGGSGDTGAVTIRELERTGVPVWLAPRAPGNRRIALAVRERLMADRIDVAFFQTGMACPIDWLVTRLTPIPLQISIHVGDSTFNPGFRLCLFDNPVNLERENVFWPDDAGRRVVLRSGVDLAAVDRWAPVGRREIGIPDGATVVGVASNHMTERFSLDYMELICRVLKRHAEVYFVGIGNLPDAAKPAFFKEQGVADRVRFPGPVAVTAPALKMLDIYANEFPLGGCTSVKEAIACGVPVVAMKWSDAHAESAAADIVGPPWAIDGRDPGAYKALLERWVVAVGERREAGAGLRRRAEQLYSAKQYVADCFALVEEELRAGG